MKISSIDLIEFSSHIQISFINNNNNPTVIDLVQSNSQAEDTSLNLSFSNPIFNIFQSSENNLI